MSGTVSKFVEINSGGAVTLAGNSGGGITTNGTVNNPLAVVINLGELGPSNTSSFVTANVPLKAAQQCGLCYVDGRHRDEFGNDLRTRSAPLISASDLARFRAPASASIPPARIPTQPRATRRFRPTAAVNATTGRYEFTATRSNLSAFATSTTALSGSFIMNAVPRSNANGLTVPAIFAVKPQFYENGTTTDRCYLHCYRPVRNCKKMKTNTI